MKRKIIIRQVKSKPPTIEQIKNIYIEIYNLDQKNAPSIQMKTVFRNSECIYVLKEQRKDN